MSFSTTVRSQFPLAYVHTHTTITSWCNFISIVCIANNSHILLCFCVVATLPASEDDDDNSNGIHVFYRRERVMADRGEAFVVINVVAPADANEVDVVNYNDLNDLTPGSVFQGLYQISNIQSGGVARAIYTDQTGIMFAVIGALNTTIELFGKTLRVLYNHSGCSIQCSIDMFTCYSCCLTPCVSVDYYIQTLFYTTRIHIVHTLNAVQFDVMS